MAGHNHAPIDVGKERKHMTKSQRLLVIIGISFCFFIAEIAVGFYTGSLALIADAFHYLNDLVGFIVQFVAFKISERSESPKEFSFGWQRANLLGAFFNGVFLIALGVSIFLQSIERFITPEVVKKPMLMLIIACIGLTLNIISALFLHEHDDDVQHVVSHAGEDENTTGTDVPASVPLTGTRDHARHRHERPSILNRQKTGSHDFGMMGILIHLCGDALNNVGVIIAALIIWKTTSPNRFYADPAVSMAIAFMIFFSSIPLVKKTGAILMETVPTGVNPQDVRYDLEQVPGVISIHELHIWRLNQRKSIASAHVVVSNKLLENFVDLAKVLNECFHAYGIHSATLQPELAEEEDIGEGEESSARAGSPSSAQLRRRAVAAARPVCRITCGTTTCETLTCCN